MSNVIVARSTGPARIQCKRNRVLESGAPAFLPCGGCRVFGKLRTSASQVALKQGAPEDDPRKIDCQRFELRRRGSAEPQRTRRMSAAGQRHRNALHFHRSLGAVTELDRQLECAPVARQRAGTVAANERAVGKKMVREVLRTQVTRSLRQRKRFARHRLDDFEFAETHQDLQKPDARAVDEQRIADRLLQAESFFHQSPRVGVAGIEAAPAELDQRAGDLLRLSLNAP